MNLNQVNIAGNLARDPRVRQAGNGQVASIAVAVSWRTRGQNPQEKTTFIEVEAWGKKAELLEKWFSKGKPIFVSGRLETQEWTDKQTGQKRYKTLVVADDIQFVGPPSGNNNGGGGYQSQGYQDRYQSQQNQGSGGHQGQGGGGSYSARSNQGGGGGQRYDDAPTDDDLPF